MAISTFMTYLMLGSGTGTITWSNLCPIKDFPDLGAAPEPIEVTSLSDYARAYIEGIENSEQKAFTCNYDPTVYATVQGMKGTEKDIAVWFGASENDNVYTPDGSRGKFEGKGYLSVYINGGGVNEPVNMTITATMTKGFVKAS